MNPKLKNTLLKITLLLPLLAHSTVNASQANCSENLNFDVRTLNTDSALNLCEAYQGKVILIVNTASKCGYTGQYEALESLYEKHKQDGLVVLGFPSNDFGGQEPGTEQQIADFCVNTYAIKFPMFQKTSVKKANADPLYKKLGEQAGYPRWNFHKYLLDRDGKLVDSFTSPVTPDSPQIVGRIEQLLKQ
jgi:glutathione peroxidase